VQPTQCTVCKHEKRAEIDEAILRGDANRRIATHYGLSEAAIRRHIKNGHIAQDLIEGGKEEEHDRVLSLYQSFADIQRKVELVCEAAEEENNWSVVLQGLREMRELLKFKIQMAALQPEANIDVDPITFGREIWEYLSAKHPKAHKGLLEHLNERFEYYRTRISENE